MPPRKAPLTFKDITALACALPGVEVSTSYGTPALKVRGKLFARLKEDGETLVLRAPEVVRTHLIQSDPNVFFITDHYRDHPWVLVRLTAIQAAQLKPLLADAWREVSPIEPST